MCTINGTVKLFICIPSLLFPFFLSAPSGAFQLFYASIMQVKNAENPCKSPKGYYTAKPSFPGSNPGGTSKAKTPDFTAFLRCSGIFICLDI